MSNNLYWYSKSSTKFLMLNNNKFNLFASIRIATYDVMLVDRLRQLDHPLNIKFDEDCKIPENKLESANLFKLYDEYMERRALELIKLAHDTHRHIYLYFSGGIDSTSVVTAFLKYCKLNDIKDIIKIITSNEVFVENPEFMKKYIIGTFEVISSYRPVNFSDKIVTSGEYNGHLFILAGPVKDVSKTLNTDIYEEYYSIDIIRKFLSLKNLTDEAIELWINIIDRNVKSAPVEIKTLADFFWWFYFNYEWQALKYRILCIDNSDDFSPDIKNSLHHFFDTDYFQVWGMNNPHRNHNKFISKDFIYKFDRNEFYYRNKGRFGSLYNMFKVRPKFYGLTDDFKRIYDRQELLSCFK